MAVHKIVAHANPGFPSSVVHFELQSFHPSMPRVRLKVVCEESATIGRSTASNAVGAMVRTKSNSFVLIFELDLSFPRAPLESHKSSIYDWAIRMISLVCDTLTFLCER